MQWSKKQKGFSEFFPAFLKLKLKTLKTFLKKEELYNWCIFEIRDCKRLGYINVKTWSRHITTDVVI